MLGERDEYNGQGGVKRSDGTLEKKYETAEEGKGGKYASSALYCGGITRRKRKSRGVSLEVREEWSEERGGRDNEDRE